MALPDYLLQEAGTPIVFGQPGAAGVTHDLSLDAMAGGTARMSEYADLGQYPPEEIDVDAELESGTAPTAAGAQDVYVVFSDSTSSWPAGLTGVDGVWPADGNEDEWAKQLDTSYVLSVKATNDGNVLQKQSRSRIPVLGRYVAVVVDNNWDQAIRNRTPDSDNLSRVTITKRFTGIFNNSDGTP